MGSKESNEERMVAKAAELDSRDVLYALDERDVGVWLVAMRDWRAVNAPTRSMDRSTERWSVERARYVGSRAVLLDILARMGIDSVAAVSYLERGEVFVRDRGWHEPTDEEDEFRMGRLHSDYVSVPDPLDPNWTDELDAA